MQYLLKIALPILLFISLGCRRIVGRECVLEWRFQTGDMIKSIPAADEDGTIYFGSDDGCLYAIKIIEIY